MARRYELTKAQWQQIKNLLPGKAGDRGRTAADNRTFVKRRFVGFAQRSLLWCHLPERYGNWKSTHKRFTCWAKAGVWEEIFEALSSDPQNEYLMIDTTPS
jgi:transposase